MQKGDTEEWTVTKLCQLLGKHITALEIADDESYSASPQMVSGNKSTQRAAGGLLAGTANSMGILVHSPG